MKEKKIFSFEKVNEKKRGARVIAGGTVKSRFDLYLMERAEHN